MRNFARINNYWNRKQAWSDWNELEFHARQMGLGDESDRLRPDVDAGWRTIDKRIAQLRAAMKAVTAAA